MEDRYGRPIEYLRLSVTDRCNLRCRYCMPEDGVPPLAHGEVLSYEEMLRVAKAATALGVSRIRVTGGEPLVRKGLSSFIEQLARLPGAPEISLTTNGLLLAEAAQELRRAGLARVNVSLDTLREDRFVSITRRHGLAKVLEGLHAAEEAGLSPVKLNMVPIRGVNDDEIGDFARLSFDHPWEIRFIEYMPFGDQLGYGPQRRVPADTIREHLAAIGELREVTSASSGGPARLYGYPGAPGRVGLITAVSEHFCRSCNRLRLTADGLLRPCLFSREEIDIKQALRGGGTDAELRKILLQSVGAKPGQHRLGETPFDPGSRTMHGIGG